MAEVFGIVAGTLSIAGLFNNCVDCFEYIQLGRHFGRDYDRCQLRLDIAKTRLGRWGEAVKINDNPIFNPDFESTNKPAQLIRSILEEIVILFESANKTSRRYELVADQQDLTVFRDGDLQPIVQRLHSRLKELAKRRQKGTSLAKKATWALYDGRNLEKLADQIATFVDELDKVSNVEATCRKLADIEIEELEDESSLTALRHATDGIDTALSDAVGEKMATIASHQNYAKEIRTEDSARVLVGDSFTDGALLCKNPTKDITVNNSVETASAKGQSGVQIGNVFGGKGLWNSQG